MADSGSTSEASDSAGKPLLKIVGADIREYSAQDRISAEQIAAARQSIDPNDISSAVQTLTTRITLLEESILARDLENQELRERMRFLEEKFERSARVLEEFRNAAKVLEFEQGDLALLQNQELESVEVLGVESGEVTVGETGATTGADSAIDDRAGSAAESVEVQAASNVSASVEEIIQGADGDDSSATGSNREEGEIKNVSAQTSSTWWQRLSSNLAFDEQTKKITLFGVIIASFLGLWAIRRRRKVEDQEIEKAVLDAEKESAKQQSNLTGSSLALAAEKAERHFDPIAEAKVYIAYGRQEEAEQVLRDALEENPDHPELALELLDVYRHGNDVRSFSEFAGELKSSWPISQPDQWQRVVDMGREYLPGHELFEDDGLGAMDDDLGLALSSLDEGNHEIESIVGSEFGDQGTGEKRNPYLAVNNVSGSDASSAAISSSDSNNADSVDGESTLEESETGKVHAANNGSGANGNGSTDADNFDDSTVQWDGVGTKINLAKAYIDMGDIENARDLIEQAMKEGSDQQREQASVLATQLAANLHS